MIMTQVHAMLMTDKVVPARKAARPCMLEDDLSEVHVIVGKTQ